MGARVPERDELSWRARSDRGASERDDDDRTRSDDRARPAFSAPDAVPTPWSDVVRTISEAELFWISTVRADGSPHVTPIPAVRDDDALHFCTGTPWRVTVVDTRRRGILPGIHLHHIRNK